MSVFFGEEILQWTNIATSVPFCTTYDVTARSNQHKDATVKTGDEAKCNYTRTVNNRCNNELKCEERYKIIFLCKKAIV